MKKLNGNIIVHPRSSAKPVTFHDKSANNRMIANFRMFGYHVNSKKQLFTVSLLAPQCLFFVRVIRPQIQKTVFQTDYRKLRDNFLSQRKLKSNLVTGIGALSNRTQCILRLKIKRKFLRNIVVLQVYRYKKETLSSSGAVFI